MKACIESQAVAEISPVLLVPGQRNSTKQPRHDLTKLTKIHYSLSGCAGCAESGIVIIEVRDCKEINLAGLVALTCNATMVDRSDPDILSTGRDRIHTLPKAKQLLKTMLNDSRNTWMSFTDAKAIMTACSFREKSLQTVWDFQKGANAVAYRYHNTISSHDCGQPLLRALHDFNRHDCYRHPKTPNKRYGQVSGRNQYLALFVRECVDCNHLFWDNDSWTSHMKMHLVSYLSSLVFRYELMSTLRIKLLKKQNPAHVVWLSGGVR